jgi:hypothetical protein
MNVRTVNNAELSSAALVEATIDKSKKELKIIYSMSSMLQA